MIENTNVELENQNNKTFNVRIQSKHDSEENWNNISNFVPLSGEIIIYDADTKYDYERIKIGDGTTSIYNLPFIGEGIRGITVLFDAKGDGVTDNTVVFQTALSKNRIVYVPGGIYILSDTLQINENCSLILSQDAVLKFTQTNKNCIEMKRLANLQGNHATIFVPYTFNANVIHASTDVDSAGGNNSNVPPFTTWGPLWKMSRYITDINICKVDESGFHYLKTGNEGDECCGTAVYIKCGENDPTTYMWGVNMSGLRIAGSFTYGIRAHNIGATENCWNHDMRIEGVIESCETGMSIENCHMGHFAVTVQPRLSRIGEVPYAKYGIKLIDSHNVDLSQSIVWDWHVARKDSEEYTHIAMYGDCYGLILNEPDYYNSRVDIRENIYTDVLSNLEKMVVLQEPITRWFKPIENKPFFYDGNGDKKLVMQEEFDECFIVDRIPQFTNALSLAIDTDGSIYNDIGYTVHTGAVNAGTDGISIIEGSVGYYGHTGFISCKAGDTLYIKNIDLSMADGWSNAIMFDENFTRIAHNNLSSILDGTTTEFFKGTITEDGGTLVLQSAYTRAAYVRISYLDTMLGSNPIITVNEPIQYIQDGFLADSIKVKGENILGNIDLANKAIADENGNDIINTYATKLEIPTEAYINSLIDIKLGVIENGSY